jgi:hypothetical protein
MGLEQKLIKIASWTAKVIIPLQAAGFVGYSFLNSAPIHDYNHRAATLGTHWAYAGLAIAWTATAGIVALPILKKGVELLYRFSEWSAEKIGAARATGRLVSNIGLIAAGALAATAIAGAANPRFREPYNPLNMPAKALVEFLRPTKELKGNLKYFSVKMIPAPPADSSDFGEWHKRKYGCTPEEAKKGT